VVVPLENSVYPSKWPKIAIFALPIRTDDDDDDDDDDWRALRFCLRQEREERKQDHLRRQSKWPERVVREVVFLASIVTSGDNPERIQNDGLEFCVKCGDSNNYLLPPVPVECGLIW